MSIGILSAVRHQMDEQTSPHAAIRTARSLSILVDRSQVHPHAQAPLSEVGIAQSFLIIGKAKTERHGDQLRLHSYLEIEDMDG
jgi:hypothetical protein